MICHHSFICSLSWLRYVGCTPMGSLEQWMTAVHCVRVCLMFWFVYLWHRWFGKTHWTNFPITSRRSVLLCPRTWHVWTYIRPGVWCVFCIVHIICNACVCLLYLCLRSSVLIVFNRYYRKELLLLVAATFENSVEVLLCCILCVFRCMCMI